MGNFLRLISLTAVLTFLLSSGTVMAQVLAGRDYRLVDPPQPVESGKNVEVIEFFSYGCIHCYNLEPALNAWLKRKLADVEFKRVPVAFRDSWVPLVKAYYTIEAMGLIDKLNYPVYAAIHDQNIRLHDTKVLFDWVAKQGVDRKKFVDTFNSFVIQSRAQRALNMTQSYGIESTPSLVVDGRYQPTPSMEFVPGTKIPDEKRYFEKYFRVLDELVALARKTRGGK